MRHSDQKKALILIVDDDRSMRMLMSASLQQAGFEVAEAQHGREALDIFEKSHPDAILLDVMMPEMDGFETCETLRKTPGGEHTPVLMVTGLDDIDSIHRAFNVGATDFIAKPINWVMLGYRVRYVLRANQAFLDLHKSQAQLSEAQQLAKLGSWEWDPRNDHLSGSAEFFRILGMDHSRGDLNLGDFIEHMHPEDAQAFKGAVEKTIQEENSYFLDFRLLLPDSEERIIYNQGAIVFDHRSKQNIVRGIVQDVTKLRKAEAQIRHLAYFDGLTGLANRVRFKERLEQALVNDQDKNQIMALLFLDLDRFKLINDTLGHHVGDQLLIHTANRISNSVRETDRVARGIDAKARACVSRLGGDEFTVMLPELAKAQDAALVAKRIIERINQPLYLEGNEIFVTTSIGISIYPFDGQDADTLIKHADSAMYEAKNSGRNNFQFYKDSLNSITSERLSLENDLRKALERKEFLIHYQPQCDSRTGRITGAEALVRWNHPKRGLVNPNEFIPLAEESGLIHPMTDWILHTACAQNKRWQDMGMQPIKISVNISGRQYAQQKIAQLAAEALESTGLNPRLLGIEITESTLMENKEDIKSDFRTLKDLGVTIAIDDFGTGYSSLAYLKTFPIDYLKIDRSFVRDIATDPNDAAIVRAIIAMSHGLDLQVIAEGVENVEQLSFLKELSCNEFQGFLFSRPLPAEEFFELTMNTNAFALCLAPPCQSPSGPGIDGMLQTSAFEFPPLCWGTGEGI